MLLLFLIFFAIESSFCKVIINEIYYHDSTYGVEFVELHNTNMSGSVSLLGWAISGGIKYNFPDTASIAAGGFIVIAESVR